MNIALSTFAILILLIPGLIFRRFYYTEEFSKQYVKQSLFELFLVSFIPSLLFHSIWYYAVQLTPYKVDLQIIGNIFTSDQLSTLFQNLKKYPLQIILYHLSIFTFSAGIGFISKQVVRKLKWDRKKKLFRYQNSWHYLFKGEFFDFPKSAFDLINDEITDIEFFYIDVLTEIGGSIILYEGILVDYELARDGGLNYIVLKEVQRKFVQPPQKVENNENSSVEVPGHIMIIPYRTITNMNISFYKLNELSDNKFQVVLVS